MWYESLPSFTVVMACLTAPHLCGYIINRVFLGTPFRRKLTTHDEGYHYLRDTRLSGNDFPYKQMGLENISLDEEEK